MKLNVESVPEELTLPEGPQVGDVYRIEGGRGGPRVRVIVARSGEACYALVYSLLTGEVTGVDQCGAHYLERKYRIGRAREMPVLDVDWSQSERLPGNMQR